MCSPCEVCNRSRARWNWPSLCPGTTVRLVTFWHADELRAGVRDGELVQDLGPLASFQSKPESWTSLRPPTGLTFEIENLRLGPSLMIRGKLICIGLNYKRHVEESGSTPPNTPVVFSKFDNSIAASGQDITLSDAAEQYDYEAELGVVIGRRARNVPERAALEHVFGYCNANDLSARDLQSRSSQWLLGKSLDGFLPLGPELVTADEVSDPQALGIRCWVDGELRQNSTTADMIFSVAEIISYLSKYMTLETGDFIATGTPEGVILGMNQKTWLRAGNLVEIQIEGLGCLRNRFVRGEASVQNKQSRDRIPGSCGAWFQ